MRIETIHQTLADIVRACRGDNLARVRVAEKVEDDGTVVYCIEFEPSRRGALPRLRFVDAPRLRAGRDPLRPH